MSRDTRDRARVVNLPKLPVGLLLTFLPGLLAWMSARLASMNPQALAQEFAPLILSRIDRSTAQQLAPVLGELSRILSKKNGAGLLAQDEQPDVSITRAAGPETLTDRGRVAVVPKIVAPPPEPEAPAMDMSKLGAER